MKNKRFLSLVTVVAMCVSLFANITVLAESETYTADFTKLEAKTYGTATDIIELDDYTTLNLTYAGTYIDSGKVYLKSGTPCNGNGKYADGSHISFTAPSDGKLVVNGADIGWFEGDTYKGYSGSISIDAVSGTTYNFGYRKDSTYIGSITFTPSTEPDEPEITATPQPYVSPETTWDFNDYAPASSGKNVPYVTGSAEYSDKEIKFPSGATGSGYITVDFDDAINNNVEFEFDVIEHSQTLGQQYINCKISNSEGEEIVSLNAHPYQSTGTYAGVNKLLIAGEQAAVDEEIRTPFGFTSGNLTVHNKISIDYNAREVTVTVGSKSFTGTIPAKTIKDIAKFEFGVSRNKTAADRYISFDNLSVKEFTSTKPAPEDDSIKDYTAVTLAEVPSRVKAAESGTPLVVYLSSKARFGTDNSSQVYGALDFFELLDGKATLAAPQAATSWDTAKLKEYISAAKTQYNSSKVIVIGQNEGAAAAYALSDTVDKIIPINGASDITASTAKVWAFAGYLDENIGSIRTTVSALQKAKADVMYTEFPFDSGNISAKAAAKTGLTDWILNDTENTKVVDLVLFAGQSNMAGRGGYAGETVNGVDYPPATECVPGHGFEYHPVTEPGVLTTASEPFGKYENNTVVHDNGGDGKDRRSGDMVSSFMESYYNVTGVPIVGVQCSRGGQESKYFAGDAVLAEMASRYNEAKEYLENAGYTIGNKYMVWCQGETDADNNRGADVWTTNVTRVFNHMKTNTALTDMFIIRIGHCRVKNGTEYEINATIDPRYKAINLAQKELADSNNDITAVASFYTDEYLALMRDQYHYYQPAYNSIGNIAGNNTAVTLYSKGTWMAYPEPDDEPPLDASKFEITSSSEEIDVSALTNYGADTYRVYKADKSYVDVKANANKVTNPTGSDEVTVVPIYRFSYSETTPDGYTSARNAYTKETGYGISGTVTLDTNGALPSNGTLTVSLPKGRYDINVLRQGGTRFNVCNDGYRITTNEGINNQPQNRANDTALMYAPQILNEDETIDLSVTGTSGSPRIASVEIVRVPEKYQKSVVWIAGDSESSNYYPNSEDDLDSKEIMRTGFGMMLGKFLSSDKYKISNLGEPSATVKMWSEGNLESVLHNIASGDTVIIDFGINEAVSKSNSLTEEEMKTKMQEIFTAVKAKGATPILVSPVSCGKYQNKAFFTYQNENNAMYAFAEAEDVDCIDLNKWTQLYIAQAAEETNTTEDDWKLLNFHAGDNLHLTQHSALLAASFIAAGMKALGYETTDFGYTYTDISSIGEGDVRGTETENKRIYSVAAAERFMADSKILKPGITVEGTTVTVTANPDANGTPALIQVTRSADGALEAVKTYNLTFNNNTASVEGLSLNNGDELYAWDSLTGMEPLAGKKTVTELSQSAQ